MAKDRLAESHLNCWACGRGLLGLGPWTKLPSQSPAQRRNRESATGGAGSAEEGVAEPSAAMPTTAADLQPGRREAVEVKEEEGRAGRQPVGCFPGVAARGCRGVGQT